MSVRDVVLAGAIVVGVALSCIILGSAAGQDFSGLKDQELHPQRGGGSLADLLVRDKGSIDKAVVSDDRERRLVVTITYRGLGGREVGGVALGADGRPVPQIHSAPVKLLVADGQADIPFVLADDAPQDLKLETTAIVLEISRKSPLLPPVSIAYPVRKRWQARIAPENVVIEMTAVPVGAAAALTEQQPGQPPKIIRPPTRAFKVDATAIAPVTVGPAAGSVQTPVLTAPPPRGGAGFRALGDKHLIDVHDFGFGVPPAVTDLGGKGPANTTIPWLTSVDSELSLAQEDISRLGTVYEDQNPASGIYYYLPRGYRLKWSPDEGFAMRMLYQAVPAEGQPGQVVTSARLSAGLDTGEISLAKELLKAYCTQHGRKFTELRPIPLSAAPAISLSDALKSLYSIPADRISVEALSDALAEVSVSWATDTVTKENLQLALTSDVGVSGTATLTPAGGSVPPQAVAVNIALADPETLGRFSWTRGQNWRNVTPYPLKPKHLCALLVPSDTQPPIVYAWSLGDQVVPPQAQVAVEATRVPGWVDQQAKRTWITYSIPTDRDRELYDRQVLQTITGGVTSLGSYNLTFKTLTPLKDSGAAELSITVRSKYFDPKTKEMQVKPALPLPEDQKEYTLGPIYLVNRQPGEEVPGDPLFEYRLSAVMPDGTEHVGRQWVAVNALRVIIGKRQLEEAVGTMGGEAQP